ncbi:MAG TPA: NADH-quinone oxidoreductase subunit I [Nitrospinota bacterium]|nr:NADH-quinone oxidoreductase subunit I [Nitrospinota bacterium]
MKNDSLSFWERLYIKEVLKGLILTSKHFFQNMKVHILNLFGVKTERKGAVTIQYPEEKKSLSTRHRNLHRLTVREDDSPRCVACMMCETICPAKCIYIVAGEHPDPSIEKYPVSFDIDLGICVYCGFCVEACPEDAIRMDTRMLEIASYSREGMKYNKEMLMDHNKYCKKD